MKRWTCPRCGSGKLAPARARKDDARRWCLSCSATTGRMVERTCPSADAARAARRESQRTAALRQRTRERERATTRHTVAGIDVRDEWQRLSSLPICTMREARGAWPPGLTVAHSTAKRRVSGHCKTIKRIVHVTFWPGVTPAEVRELLAHELAHAVAPLDDSHSQRWRNTYLALIEQGFGIAPPVPLPRSTWELDLAVRDALAASTWREP